MPKRIGIVLSDDEWARFKAVMLVEGRGVTKTLRYLIKQYSSQTLPEVKFNKFTPQWIRYND